MCTSVRACACVRVCVCVGVGLCVCMFKGVCVWVCVYGVYERDRGENLTVQYLK